MFHELTMRTLIKGLVEGLRVGFYWLDVIIFYSATFPYN
jgi:hypothetical protein